MEMFVRVIYSYDDNKIQEELKRKSHYNIEVFYFIYVVILTCFFWGGVSGDIRAVLAS